MQSDPQCFLFNASDDLLILSLSDDARPICVAVYLAQHDFVVGVPAAAASSPAGALLSVFLLPHPQTEAPPPDLHRHAALHSVAVHLQSDAS